MKHGARLNHQDREPRQTEHHGGHGAVKWPGLEKFARYKHHFRKVGGVPFFSGISGGRTSALMAILHSEDVTLTFQNTGKEADGTYEFLDRLDHALGRRIVWLEWRPPPNIGDPPKMHRVERVTFKTAARDGSPFRGMLQALADYRRIVKGEPPIAPWAKGRICTGYLKHKTKEHFIQSLGIDAYDNGVGLRYDEPNRVTELRKRSTQKVTFRMPLADSFIEEADVLEFWEQQDFNLEIDNNVQGNCTACFLKDQSDISRSLQDLGSDPDWWESIEEDFPGFGGHNFPGYAQLRLEGPMRLAIEAALRDGAAPDSLGHLRGLSPVTDAKRFLNVVRQERKLIEGGRKPFKCNCGIPPPAD